MENIDTFLRELKESSDSRWIANEVDETLSEGISINVKEAAEDSKFDELVIFQNLPAQERNKRQKYETSRPFSDDEKLDVVIKAFEVVYVELPAIRKSAILNLTKFDSNIQTIVFSSSDEEIIEKRPTHEIDREKVIEESIRYKELLSNFMTEIKR